MSDKELIAKEKDDNLFADERKQQIVEYINTNKKTTVNNLCDHFGVSPATIRNDLRELEANGLLKRTHGGAMANVKKMFELESVQKAVKNIDEKSVIAKLALEYIDDGDSICLDTGTTTFELAKQLMGKKDLIVVTNDLNIATYLEQKTDFKIMVTGGIVRNGYNCLTGATAIKSIKDIRVDKAFMSTNGFSVARGASTPNLEMAEIKRQMLLIADECIMLCTSNKIGSASFAKFAEAADFDFIITDSMVSEEKIQEIEDAGVDVEIAKLKG